MAPKSSATIRWIDLSEAQKKDVVRFRNVQNCKKNRQKWKENDEEIKQLYESNEKRIAELEQMAEKFSKELEAYSASSSRSSKSKSRRG